MANTLLSPAIQPALAVVDGIPTVSSVDVARHFGKRHNDVLKAIKNLCDQLPPDYLRNFAQVIREYSNGKGGTQTGPTYNLTRDGFTLLAMGLTGEKALAFKLVYIDAFNQLEQAYLQRLQDDAQKAIEARDNQLFIKTAKWKEELAHRTAGETLIRKIRSEPDPLLRRHHFNTLASLYRRLGDEPPTYVDLVAPPAAIRMADDGMEGGAA